MLSTVDHIYDIGHKQYSSFIRNILYQKLESDNIFNEFKGQITTIKQTEINSNFLMRGWLDVNQYNNIFDMIQFVEKFRNMLSNNQIHEYDYCINNDTINVRFDVTKLFPTQILIARQKIYTKNELVAMSKYFHPGTHLVNKFIDWTFAYFINNRISVIPVLTSGYSVYENQDELFDHIMYPTISDIGYFDKKNNCIHYRDLSFHEIDKIFEIFPDVNMEVESVRTYDYQVDTNDFYYSEKESVKNIFEHIQNNTLKIICIYQLTDVKDDDDFIYQDNVKILDTICTIFDHFPTYDEKKYNPMQFQYPLLTIDNLQSLDKNNFNKKIDNLIPRKVNAYYTKINEDFTCIGYINDLPVIIYQCFGNRIFELEEIDCGEFDPKIRQRCLTSKKITKEELWNYIQMQKKD